MIKFDKNTTIFISVIVAGLIGLYLWIPASNTELAPLPPRTVLAAEFPQFEPLPSPPRPIIEIPVPPMPVERVTDYYYPQKMYHGGFFSFMSYRAITSRSSRQWQMQQSAVTGNNGIRMYDGWLMIAIGTGWGYCVGDVVDVTLSTGIVVTAIIGDIKDNVHTCANNITTRHNGCVLEFIVCIPSLPTMARRMGDMTFVGFYGYVESVVVSSE